MYLHSPVDEAALTFQATLVNKHNAVSEVLNPASLT